MFVNYFLKFSVYRVYCREAAGAFVVYDVSRPDTLEKAIGWKNVIDDNLSTADKYVK